MECLTRTLAVGLLLSATGCMDLLPTISQTDGSSSSTGTTADSTLTPSTSTGLPPGVDSTATTGSTSSETTAVSTGPSGSSGSSSASSTGEPTGCHPLLAEIFHDPAGPGVTNKQWIKLYNPCEDMIDLSEYSLGWAGSDYDDGTMNLSTVVAPGGCVLVGGPISDQNNEFPVLDIEMDFDPNLGSGGGVGDGVALFQMDADRITPDTIPLDAVIYGDNNNDMLLDSTGAIPLSPHVGSAFDQRSLQRTSVADDWVIQRMPMPNVCPVF